MRQPAYLPPAQVQSRLLLLAAAFLILWSAALSLSPAVRAHSWQIPLRWEHWLGLAVWSVFTWLAHRLQTRRLPDSDPYLFPIAALLSGWGLLTIWRLTPAFGLRQTLWLAFSLLVFCVGLGRLNLLELLRRYKYLWLISGLTLTALTLTLGANPAGTGPRLWLGCCGIYLQPSEPLKLLMALYLAAYFSQNTPSSLRMWPLLLPSLFLIFLALLLLFIQRDLGAASLFVFLYTASLYHALGRKRLLFFSLLLMFLLGLLGYTLFDLIKIRVEGWLFPWNDPSGHACQIVQSLLAIANGGLLGRGPGLGSPGLVPLSHSDFIFPAIVEESGLLGAIALLLLFALLITRGYLIALRAESAFHRLLAASLSAWLGAQALLIIGGTLRLVPLTGVTLPFLSYGGSSLLTTFVTVLLLLHISQNSENNPAPLKNFTPYLLLPALLGLGLAAAGLATGWWSIVRAQDLLTRTDNPRRAIGERFVPRGSLLDRHNQSLAVTQGEPGAYTRALLHPALSPTLGYSHPVYGQAGLEAAYDAYLRGLAGYPSGQVLLHELLYGTPPPGLNVRLSLDLSLQTAADELLQGQPGAAVLLQAETGETLALSSFPTFDANRLEESAPSLQTDPASPLLNRTTQAQYAAQPLFAFFEQIEALENTPRPPEKLFEALGLDAPVGNASPLQAALAFSVFSADGLRPLQPRLALAVETPAQGWLTLPGPDSGLRVFSSTLARQQAKAWGAVNAPYWQWSFVAREGGQKVAWYIAGTLPEWQGTSLTLVVALENADETSARRLGQALMLTVLEK